MTTTNTTALPASILVAISYLLKTLTEGREEIVATATVAEQKALADAEAARDAGWEPAVKQALKPHHPEVALSLAQAAYPERNLTSQNAGRELRREWSEFLDRAKNHIPPDKILEIEGANYLYGELADTFGAAKTADLKRRVESARDALLAARLVVEGELDRVEAEVLSRQTEGDLKDPFFQALEVWGMSPDENDGRGPDGAGFHAGIAHYFAYWRNATYARRVGKHPFTLEGFITLSERVQWLIDHPTADEVSHAGWYSDSLGQERLCVRSKSGEFVSAFRTLGDDHVKAITYFSSMAEKAAEKWDERELGPPEKDDRLNVLGAGRRKLEL